MQTHAHSPTPLAPASAGRFLAFDTSTERMLIAVTDGERTWQHEGPGAAQASTALIPAILQLMADAGLRLDQLDAIVFGRGPGSFTGLRTACAVAQGLALGANVAVLPIDTLHAVAEEARFEWASQHPDEPSPACITAVLDARMDELYVQTFALNQNHCLALAPSRTVAPQSLQLVPDATLQLLAGNVFAVYAERLPTLPSGCHSLSVLPSARAMLRLAPLLMAAGKAQEPAQALPLYIRDKVALTTDERAEVKRQAATQRPAHDPA